MLIINADDYGISEDNNLAILEASKFGLLKSTSVMVNTPYCNYNILEALLDNESFRICLNLNIIEFKTFKKDLNPKSMLYNEKGQYNNGFVSLMMKSLDKEFLNEVEEDFRLQIEEALQHFQPAHLDSHVHIHAIPNIFKIVCKLAKEYNIPYVRTQFENPYLVPEIKKVLSKTNIINLAKVFLLDLFTILNQKTLKQYGLNTNNYLIGIHYTGNMNAKTLYYGYLANSKEGYLTEALLHPTKDQIKTNNYIEYLSLLDIDLLEKLDDVIK